MSEQDKINAIVDFVKAQGFEAVLILIENGSRFVCGTGDMEVQNVIAHFEIAKTQVIDNFVSNERTNLRQFPSGPELN